MLIGISGKSGSGKHEVAEIIRDQTHELFDLKGWADKLKDVASIITGIPVSMMKTQEGKNTDLGQEWSNLTIREFLQRFGTEGGRAVHPNIWINALLLNYDESYNWIITDTRVWNELQAIKRR